MPRPALPWATGFTFQDTVDDSVYPLLITSAVPPSPACDNNPIALVPYQDNAFGGLAFRDPCAPVPRFLKAGFNNSFKSMKAMRLAVQQFGKENLSLVSNIRREWETGPGAGAAKRFGTATGRRGQ